MNGDQIRLLSEIKKLIKLNKKHFKSRNDRNYLEDLLNLGLTEEELAFYDALTKPAAIKDFYENDQLVQITKELTEALRVNKTIDFQKRDDARAKMKMIVKRLLKKYKYPPEGMEDAVQTVMTQCELWADTMEE